MHPLAQGTRNRWRWAAPKHDEPPKTAGRPAGEGYTQSAANSEVAYGTIQSSTALERRDWVMTRFPRSLLRAGAMSPIFVGAIIWLGATPNAGPPGATKIGAPPAVSSSAPVPEGMVRIPGGTFVMGAHDPKASASDRAARRVVVAPYFLDRTEVTVRAYRACVARGACERPRKTSASCTYDMADPELPVSCVRWLDADGYCRANGQRLPSEAEWEYAARGPFSLRYPWTVGGIDCAHAITLTGENSGKSCSPAHPARTGGRMLGASAFGVLDLSGNLEEWVADWYAERLSPGQTPRAGSAHVLRGGGWQSPPSLARTTSRNWGSALEAGPNVGFRCAKDLP